LFLQQFENIFNIYLTVVFTMLKKSTKISKEVGVEKWYNMSVFLKKGG